MKVAILIDTVKRDLGLATEIKHKLEHEQLGEVQILPIFPIDGDGKFTYGKFIFGSFDFVITPSYNVARTKSIRLRALLSGAKLIEFTSEQFYSQEFEKEKLNLDYKSQYSKHIYQNFVWSDYYANKIISAGISNKEKTWIVGSPKVFKKQSENRKEGIAFVSDFSLADFNTNQLESFNNLYKCNLTLSDINAIAEERKNFIDFSIRLSKTCGKRVYIRPHPGESKLPYELAVASGVIASWPEDESFTDFIKTKEHSIVHTSTTLFETCALGIPVHSIKFGEIPKSLQRDYYKDLISFSSESEITKKICSFDDAYTKDSQRKLHYYFDNFSGAYTCSDAIISALIEIKNKTKKNNLWMRKTFGLLSIILVYPHIFFIDSAKLAVTHFLKFELIRSIISIKFSDNLRRFFDPSHKLTKESIDRSANEFDKSDNFKKIQFTHSQIGKKPSSNLTSL
ncbi:hypothetical protein AWM79_09030 [Pseudomonas agarici]|uniref:Surface carbohydrate biosynthesis protein n=2 Tax=Pseudomonas agarici TaxID=46677 RepID=A0A0X1T068_PSEAA|nr:hypothetical protein [Pseudomonas agarici]AMB85440.1 hypothetical protein AWM79_09030 [Pseudomonas agarici]NWB91931.1 hypothetical protein [Pseudomonas agarici]NWC11295.1 hypothetical protein [Pseudomonas agarici]SEL44263.1 hypothetical protein SAMN05216604_118101 [Pseudomonas agarici]